MIQHGSGVRSNLSPRTTQDLNRHSSQLAGGCVSSHGSLTDLTQGHSLQPQLYTVMNNNNYNNNNNNNHSTPPSSASSSRQRQVNGLPGVISTAATSTNQTDTYMYNMSGNINRSTN